MSYCQLHVPMLCTRLRCLRVLQFKSLNVILIPYFALTVNSSLRRHQYEFRRIININKWVLVASSSFKLDVCNPLLSLLCLWSHLLKLIRVVNFRCIISCQKIVLWLVWELGGWRRHERRFSVADGVVIRWQHKLRDKLVTQVRRLLFFDWFLSCHSYRGRVSGWG